MTTTITTPKSLTAAVAAAAATTVKSSFEWLFPGTTLNQLSFSRDTDASIVKLNDLNGNEIIASIVMISIWNGTNISQ